MKFHLPQSYKYWWPVDVMLPDADKPGKVAKQSFEMQFASISADEGTAMLAAIQALPIEQQAAHQHDELKAVCVDWRGVIGEDGEPVAFTNEALALALQFSWFSRGVYKAYGRSLAPEA
ncbi:hypothetical protein X747_14750 [Mesorhizobium sp. LNJC384A00]|uniref:hypothetical protein n=1 Tax=Mesorhizobium sp. LNJC384A00 TaxID=1287268 RepID=UPI0003CF0C34|nr:hypothetical protein [Mesorhizobium sp. LNJC384A00]ESY42036.1 hypothetical protein X747_14750 [Mesorhizobium sp. LNJC384A00]